MKIKLINHASIHLDFNEIKFLCDPWYHGSIFNDGWKLLKENSITLNEINADYIWYSHEHPDHFSVKDLNKINDNKKENVEILFQETLDRKVVNFLNAKKFNIKELKLLKEYKLSENLTIIVGSVGGFDSWILFKYKNFHILNLNDCQTNDSDLEKILNLADNKIDVLLTQFSFANWICNEGDDKLANQQLDLIKKKIDKQIKYLKPKFLIPFASFVYFCNSENFYLNKYTIRVSEIYKRYKDITQVVVLSPNDIFDPGVFYDSKNALDIWENEYDKIHDKEIINSKSIDFDEIKKTHKSYINNLKKNNNYFLIYILSIVGFFKTQKVFLRDLNKYIKFNLISPISEIDKDDKAIEMSSDSFFYLIKFQWGRGTLFINGRLKCNYEELSEFMKITKITYANNIGLKFPKSLKFKDLKKKSSFTELVDDAVE